VYTHRFTPPHRVPLRKLGRLNFEITLRYSTLLFYLKQGGN